MQTSILSVDLVKIALERAEGFAFERFAQDFLSGLEGRDFVPLGGQNDGGADGVYHSTQGKIYYQFTIQVNHRDKIRKTLASLKKSGREVKTIYFLSSRLISNSDKEEDILSEELGIIVKIRDQKFILSHINDSRATASAFESHLKTYTSFLQNLTSTKDQFFASSNITNPEVFVFLQHEITNRLGNRKLVHSLADTMIIWSLSDTDPDQNKFMTEDEIQSKIFEHFPWAVKLLKGHISQRLEILRSKRLSGREIRWYRKDRKYCLPYDTRLTIQKENQADESVKIQFLQEAEIKASQLFDADDGQYKLIADLCCKTVHLIFEKQGLLFSHFLVSDDPSRSPLIISDCIDKVIDSSNISSDCLEKYRDYIQTILRDMIYKGTPAQRLYLQNLSRTYVLLFTLQADPKIIEYFSTMSASFKLFLGSDILIRAISERYLDEKDQSVRNLLKMATQAGCTLYLSECVLEEVYTHIKASYYEFKNHYADSENYITREIASNSGKILIRSYFYAKEEGLIKCWRAYLEQFISYKNITMSEGYEQLKRYLIAEYQLKFLENSELKSVCNEDDVEILASNLLNKDDKENEHLAYNTALLVHGIYGLRKKNKESTTSTEFGYKTWWMTNQSRVLKHTAEISRKNGAKYIMRPEFILNFIAMSPSCESVREGFNNIFPTNFGLQLGHRLNEETFHKVLKDVAQFKEYEPGRITALVSEYSDQLKSDRLKRYHHDLGNSRALLHDDDLSED